MAATLYFGNLLFKMTKGNGLQDLTTEDHTAGQFQAKLADGLDRNKAVRLIRPLAMLGVRGDYLEIRPYARVASSDGNNVLVESLFAEGVEWSGVPPEVQYSAYAGNSPFVTAEFAIQSGMLKGTDRQEIQFVNNVEIASADAQSTAIAQKIRGESDSRVTFGGDVATVEACAYWSLKLKPNGDGVFMLRGGAVIWMQPGAADEVA